MIAETVRGERLRTNCGNRLKPLLHRVSVYVKSPETWVSQRERCYRVPNAKAGRNRFSPPRPLTKREDALDATPVEAVAMSDAAARRTPR